jgi:hypothetical protein
LRNTSVAVRQIPVAGQLFGESRDLLRQEGTCRDRRRDQREHNQRDSGRPGKLIILKPPHSRLQREAQQSCERQREQEIAAKDERRNHQSRDNESRRRIDDVRR